MIHELPLSKAPWQQLQDLLDQSFPLPPRDVFERVVQASHRPQRLWIATAPGGGALHGLVMLSPHSKGGHLENLAVAPSVRGRGIGHQLVKALLQSVAHDGPAMVSLTTRIPSFFSQLGFNACGQLADGASAMLILLPDLDVSYPAIP